jgi:mono/diheme cytochrome c family protein
VTRSGGRLLAAIASVLAVAAVAFWGLTRPDPLPAAAIPTHEIDLRNGETLYHAGSCLACHKAPEGAPGSDRGLPAGGTPFPTPVGTFYPQNLTPDAETGIGRWSEVDFVNAMRLGISPRGTHYFPAFPYASYRSMTMADLLDLLAWLMSLVVIWGWTWWHLSIEWGTNEQYQYGFAIPVLFIYLGAQRWRGVFQGSRASGWTASTARAPAQATPATAGS